MLTLEDCIDLCGLTHEEIRYFVEHEHISDLRAAELGQRYVVVDDKGVPHLRRAILDDTVRLDRQGKRREAKVLETFVRDFVPSAPEYGAPRRLRTAVRLIDHCLEVAPRRRRECLREITQPKQYLREPGLPGRVLQPGAQ